MSDLPCFVGVVKSDFPAVVERDSMARPSGSKAVSERDYSCPELAQSEDNSIIYVAHFLKVLESTTERHSALPNATCSLWQREPSWKVDFRSQATENN